MRTNVWEHPGGNPECPPPPPPPRGAKDERKRLLWVQMSSDFKSQSSTWLKWCPPNYQVQKSSHLLCCPLPTILGGWVPLLQGEAWFSQSQSSRLWPALCCRERITRSCRSPAETQRREIITEVYFFVSTPHCSLPVFCVFCLHSSVLVLYNCVCACNRKCETECVVRTVAAQFPWHSLLCLGRCNTRTGEFARASHFH